MTDSGQPRFRFGVQLGIDSDWPTLTRLDAWAQLARQVEERGYETLLLADHIRNTFAPLPALVSAAQATSALRVGTLALNNDLRHPVVLANEVATLDILSEGRAELGLGAGWDDADYRVTGIPNDSPAVRIERLAESLEILEGYFSGKPFSLHGRYYTVNELVGDPLPVQRPRPKILVGGGGRRVLSLAARHADIVGINPPMRGRIGPGTGQRATAAASDEKVNWVRQAAHGRAQGPELSMMVFFAAVTEDRELAASQAWFTREMALSVEEALASPHMLVGSVEEVCDVLLERRERYGVGYWVFQGVQAMAAMAPVVSRLSGC